MFTVALFLKKFISALLLLLFLVGSTLLIAPIVKAEDLNETPTTGDSKGLMLSDHGVTISSNCSNDKESLLGEVDKCGDNPAERKDKLKSPTFSQKSPFSQGSPIESAVWTVNHYHNFPDVPAGDFSQNNTNSCNKTSIALTPNLAFLLKPTILHKLNLE